MGKNLVHPTNKASAILYIYDALSTGVLLTEEELLEKFHVSSKTVGRYIKEVNVHLSEEDIRKGVIYDTG